MAGPRCRPHPGCLASAATPRPAGCGIAPCAVRTVSGAGHPCPAGPRTRASHPRPDDADAIPLRKPVQIRGHPVLRRRHPSAGVGRRHADWPPRGRGPFRRREQDNATEPRRITVPRPSRSRLKPRLRGPTRSIGSPRDGCAVGRFEGTRTPASGVIVAAEAAPTGERSEPRQQKSGPGPALLLDCTVSGRLTRPKRPRLPGRPSSTGGCGPACRLPAP
jgi:hypothetical protein